MLFVACETYASPKIINAVSRFGHPQVMKPADKFGHSPYSPLFDNGAWHGHLLPDNAAEYGGFTGNAIITEEYLTYLFERIERLQIFHGETKLQFDAAQYSLPGELVQTLRHELATVTLRLRFVSERVSLIQTTIHTKQRLTLKLDGKLLHQLNDQQTLDQQYPKLAPTMVASESGISTTFGRVRDPWALLTSGSNEYSITRTIPFKNEVKKTVIIARRKPQVIYSFIPRSVMSTINKNAYEQQKSLPKFSHPQLRIGNALKLAGQAI